MSGESLLYVADPMCSWCWGFSPVVGSIETHFGARAPLSVVVGGLAPGAQRVMDADTRASIRRHWDHVREATGQPFDYAFLKRQDFVYNTEPACRAVVVARRLRPERTVAFLDHLHAAFYRDSLDVTDEDILCTLGADFDFDRAQFTAEMGGDAAREVTRKDFALARELGIHGFPALIGRSAERLHLITVGYRPWESIRQTIETWLARDH